MRLNRPVLFVSTATAFSLLGDSVLYAVLPVPAYHHALGLAPIHVGLLLSVNRWIRMITNHLAERLIRRYSGSYLLTAALIVGSLLAVVYGTIFLFPVLLLARVTWGLCWSFIRQIGLMTVVDSVDGARIAQGMGYYSGISRLGGSAGLFVGALLCDQVGFRATLIAFGLVSLAGVVPGLLSQRERPVRAPDQDERARDGETATGPALLVCGFAVRCVSAIIMTTLGMTLAEKVGQTVVVAGITLGVVTLNGALLAGRWITDTAAAPFLGALTDRIGHWRGTCALFFAGTVVLLLATLVSNTIVLVVLVLVFFICTTALVLTLAAVAGMRGARAVASFVTATDVGSATGPLVGWTILHFIPASVVMFVIGGALFALAALVSYLVVRRQRADARRENHAVALSGVGTFEEEQDG